MSKQAELLKKTLYSSVIVCVIGNVENSTRIFFRNGGSITLLNQGQTDSLPALPVNPSDAFAIFKPNYNPPLFHKAKEQILQEGPCPKIVPEKGYI